MTHTNNLETALHRLGTREREAAFCAARRYEARGAAQVFAQLDAGVHVTSRRRFSMPDFGFVSDFLEQFHVAPQYALVGVLLIFGVTAGGVVQAAAGSLPGDRLYPLKVQIEQAMVEAQGEPKARLEARISFASRRLNDLERVKARDNVDHFRVAQAVNLYMRELTHVYEEVAALEGQASRQEIVAAASVVNVGMSALTTKLQQTIEVGKPNGLRDALTTTKVINRQSLKTLASQPDAKDDPTVQVQVQAQVADAAKRLGEVQGKVWAAGLGKVTRRPDVLRRASDDVKVLVGRPEIAEQYLVAAARAMVADPKTALEKVESAEFLTSKTEEELAGGAGAQLSRLAEQVPGTALPFPEPNIQGGVLFSTEKQ